ncbi:MAG TPA: TetR/AcrR family transcriptional regulator [Solirubrobacterales bacterium]|jgi:AcrR family transcriptional regulator|nr:TetR/AcrR family transcriptional regulator [Solirubrobacterales bacterium]
MKPTRPELPREFVAVHKRRRMIDAMAALCADQGYEATKIADIVRRAGVARKTLYDNFDGKEDLFLAAFDATVTEAMQAVESACEDTGGAWPQRIESGMAAFLRFVAEHPAAARMCLVEAMSATPAASARYDGALRQFVELLKQNTPAEADLPGTIEETLVGGVAWILNQQIRRGETERAADLLSELSEFVLSPYQHVADQQFGTARRK